MTSSIGATLTDARRDIQAAVALLTRLPVGAVRDGRAGASAFPVAGWRRGHRPT